MANLEFMSEQGFRIDGRKNNEVRLLKCRVGVFEQADGSAYVELGNTRVLASVYGPHDIRGSRNKASEEKALINCQYSMATFSTSERKKRPRGDNRSVEITSNLVKVFDAAILTESYPHSQIDIYFGKLIYLSLFRESITTHFFSSSLQLAEVIQSDGSNYAACVNAASLAIIHAGIPMKDIVCGCSAGFINGKPIVDVNYLEESVATTPIMTIAMLPKDKQILSMESTGKLHIDHLNDVMALAIEGCNDALFSMKKTILDHIRNLIEN